MRTILLRLIVHRVLMAAGVALVVIGAVFLVADGDDRAFITPGLVLLAYVTLAVLLIPKLRWRSAKSVYGEQQYTFGRDGMVFTTPISDSRLDWGYYPALIESRRFYFFRSRGQICNPIPKRAFLASDEARFRCLVGEHIETRLRGD